MEILDTFSEFLSVAEDASPEVLMRRWRDQYLNRWPWLLKIQMDDYAEQGQDWAEVALKRVFPGLPGRIEDMSRARDNLLRAIPAVHRRVEELLREPIDILNVIHVGIGSGAGWVTSVEGRQAVLYGLEMIAECGWTGQRPVKDLVAHEMGHAVHGFLRGDHRLKGGEGPLWRLYIEGFAEVFAEAAACGPVWREETGFNPPDWKSWMEENRGMLSRRFLEHVDSGSDAGEFFGSWYDIQGYRQCGHWLGRRILGCFPEDGLRGLALLESSASPLREQLEIWAGGRDETIDRWYTVRQHHH